LKRLTALKAIFLIILWVSVGAYYYNYINSFSTGTCDGYYDVGTNVQNFSIPKSNSEARYRDLNNSGRATIHSGWIITVVSVLGGETGPDWIDIAVNLITEKGEYIASMKGVGRVGPSEPNYFACCNNYHYFKEWSEGDLRNNDTESYGQGRYNEQPDPWIVEHKVFVVVDNDGNGVIDPGDYIVVNKNPDGIDPREFNEGSRLEIGYRGSGIGSVPLI